MIASFSRSGKTTSLKHLFNDLFDHTEYTPLFVSFNGDSGFVQREGESDEQAFLRGFAEQISPHPSVATGMIYTRQALEAYVAKISKPVLLLDELNVIADPPQQGLASLLRTHFLDCGAYLCHTSHGLSVLGRLWLSRGVELSRQVCPLCRQVNMCGGSATDVRRQRHKRESFRGCLLLL
uniref:Uncharacterized protein n=1 Tax=Paramoeba aestuarina TaxID=180227 RepID=A0A7S4KQA2_9EUKA|mmetsp:Transcript_23095/g.35967  ORF Transcript_23095/g.35967 Transcript_23095/m.35967 type:complete len:180 (+) Transcript_23095:882-1421(+)